MRCGLSTSTSRSSGDLQFLCALRMYLSDQILYHLTEIEPVTSSVVVHPHLYGGLYKMSSDLLYMG